VRDRNVTGVQTCALPICLREADLVARLAEAMPVHSPLISRPDHAPTVPDAQAGGHGAPSAWATRSSRAPAVAEQAGGSGAAQPVDRKSVVQGNGVHGSGS